MKRCIPKLGEQFVAYYYGLTTDRIENGKRVYEFEHNPYKFTYKQTNISGSAVFTSSKGYERKPQMLGNTILTEQRLYRIQTTDTYIPFKASGVVQMQIDRDKVNFVINKLTSLNDGEVNFIANREGFTDLSKMSIVIELV